VAATTRRDDPGVTDPMQDSQKPWEAIEDAFRRYTHAPRKRADAEQGLSKERDSGNQEAERILQESIQQIDHTIRRVKEIEASTDELIGQLAPLGGRRWDAPEVIPEDGVPQERVTALHQDVEATASELSQAVEEYRAAKKREGRRQDRIVFLAVLVMGIVGLVIGAVAFNRPGGGQHTSTPTVEPKSWSTAARTDTPTPSVAPSPLPTPLYQTYVVQAGDTLDSIAAQFGTTYQEIMELNGLTSTTIYSGTRLLIPLPGDSESPMTELARAGRIVFVSDRDGNHEIYVMNADGSEQRNLTMNSASDEHPCWSPDGSRIAFTSDRDGDFEIYTMNADGSGVNHLTRHAADDWGPSWSPDGTSIAFMSWRDGNNEIYVIEVTDRKLRRLTSNPAEDRWPSWSPDGSRIVFMSDREDSWDIYVMNSDGSGQTNLTRSTADDVYPSWSPDGRWIAFASSRTGNDEVFLMSVSGTGAVNLTENSADDWAPSWSSDGDCVAFVSNRDGNDEIYVINSDGSGETLVASKSSANDWDPSWR
jgi:Tol biopolymer transport system component